MKRCTMDQLMGHVAMGRRRSLRVGSGRVGSGRDTVGHDCRRRAVQVPAAGSDYEPHARKMTDHGTIGLAMDGRVKGTEGQNITGDVSQTST